MKHARVKSAIGGAAIFANIGQKRNPIFRMKSAMQDVFSLRFSIKAKDLSWDKLQKFSEGKSHNFTRQKLQRDH